MSRPERYWSFVLGLVVVVLGLVVVVLGKLRKLALQVCEVEL